MIITSFLIILTSILDKQNNYKFKMELEDFLDKIGVKKDIDRSIKKYFTNIEKGGPAFASALVIVPLQYYYQELESVSKRQLDYIILEPVQYELDLRNFISEMINKQLEDMSKPSVLKVEQIYCTHQFIGLPLTENYEFYPEINKSLSNFKCIITGGGEVKPYIRHTVWHCDCEFVPDMINGSPAPKCEECLKSMKEIVTLRDISEYSKLDAIPLNAVQTPRRMRKVYQKFVVILRDELARFQVVKGNAYIITGIYDIYERAFLASNIVEIQDY